MKLKIGTLNLRNNLINRTSAIDKRGNNIALEVAELIEKEKFDVLGTQELTRNFTKNIKKYLKNYNFYGKYKIGNNFFAKNIKTINDYNENNSIITKHKVIKTYTKRLPFITHKFKDISKMFKIGYSIRIFTMVLIEINDYVICFINTHLDQRIESVRIRQLKRLKKEIKKYIKKYPIVLTGDFNMDLDNSNFKNFIKDLDDIGIKRVEVNDKTNSNRHNNLSAIDHIFIPNKWDVLEKGCKELESITDHKEVYVNVKINKRDL